jgi:hypothetical protein
MKTPLLCSLALAVLTVSLPCPADPAFRFGTAAVDISPPPGTPLAGYYHERASEGVLDPLYCRAMVIESDGTRAAFVSLDLISVTRAITDAARERIEASCGISATHVLVSATHAHTGPELAERGPRAAAFGGKSPRTVAYTEGLPARIHEAVQEAVSQLQPAALSQAVGRCEGLAFNRRYFMRDGSVGWNPGKLNPNIMLPAGPIDPQVGVLLAAPPGDPHPAKVLATYVNFAMHPDTTGGARISGDWPGALARTLAAYHGPQHVTLLGNGASGNLNHLDFTWPWPNSGPPEQNRIATILGAAVFLAYKDLDPLKPEPLRAANVQVDLAPASISPEEIDAAHKLLASAQDDREAPFMQVVRAYRAVELEARQGQPLTPEVQVIALGRQLAWVALPGEVFVELGLAIKKRSPFAQTMIVTLANENIGYIPDRRSYAEGNYEPESARCAPGSGEKLVEAAVDLLQRLHAAGSAEPNASPAK